MFLSTEQILNEIKLPDYKGRHVFTAKLRLVIFIVFWALSAIYYKGIWEASPFVPISISLAFLATGIAYHNILKGRWLLLSFLIEILSDLYSITTIVYLTGGETSQYFTTYIIYSVAAGALYSNSIALLTSTLGFLFYIILISLLYIGVLEPFHYKAQDISIFGNSRLSFFINAFLLGIFLPIVIYASKIANHFTRVKERAVEERNKQLVALNQISSTIKGFVSLEKAVRQVLSAVIEGLGYEICFLVIQSKKENTIYFHAPKLHPVTQQIELILGTSFSKLRLESTEENYIFQTINRNKILFRQRLYELVRGIEPAISEEVADHIQESLGFKKFVITPLVAERKVLGALIGVSKDEYIEESSVGVFEGFANQAALALESAQLFEELRQKNRDLLEANKIKGDFLAIMSHELRTPLTAVIGFSELLLEEVVGELNVEQKDYLREVVQNSEHLLQLINSILDLSKIESGKMDLHKSVFHLSETVREVRNTIRPLLKKKGLKLELDMPLKLPPIEADSRKIRQVLLNLLSNAIKFTPDQGSILLQIRYYPNGKNLWGYPKLAQKDPFEEGYFKMMVEDTGIGIQEKDLNEIFDPFNQVDSSVTRKYQGTGLGLTLTKQFVEMHHGVIWAESEFEKGSRFTILLPGKPLQSDLENEPTQAVSEETGEIKLV